MSNSTHSCRFLVNCTSALPFQICYEQNENQNNSNSISFFATHLSKYLRKAEPDWIECFKNSTPFAVVIKGKKDGLCISSANVSLRAYQGLTG